MYIFLISKRSLEIFLANNSIVHANIFVHGKNYKVNKEKIIFNVLKFRRTFYNNWQPMHKQISQIDINISNQTLFSLSNIW